MGAFKPLLPFGDGTVIEACINNLRGAVVNEIVVVVGHRANELQKHLDAYELRWALNPHPDSEMGESIRCGSPLIALMKLPQLVCCTLGFLYNQCNTVQRSATACDRRHRVRYLTA